MSDSWISKIDVNQYVKQLMNNESQRIDTFSNNELTQFTNLQQDLKVELNIFGPQGMLRNLFGKLYDSLEELDSAFTPVYQASSSNTDVAAVKVNENTVPGTHQLVITQLAQAESISSKLFNVAANTTALNLTNNLTVTVGSENFPVPVDTNDSLQTIANKINLGASVNNMGVVASVVATVGGYQLLVASTQTGIANKVTIAEAGPGALDLNDELVAAADAKFTFDTLSFQQAANLATIQGLDLTIANIGSADIVVTTTNPTSSVVTAANNVVNNYNNVMSYITQKQIENPASFTDLELYQQALQTLINQAPALDDIGINLVSASEANLQAVVTTFADGSTQSVTPTGLLTLDESTLKTELQTDFAAVHTNLFGTDAVLKNVKDTLDPSSTSDSAFVRWLGVSTTAINGQLSDVADQISEGKKKATDLKAGLVLKYAQLDLVLSKLQVTDQMLSQQIAVMNNRG